MIRTQTAVLILLALSQEPDAGRFRVQIWGDLSAEFHARVRTYADLRAELERGLPPLQVTDDTAAILGRTRALAARLRKARKDAKAGDIFTPDVRDAFRTALQSQVDAGTCAAVFEENPGSITVPINGRYPTHAPLSTMPPNVLAILPPLPVDIEYRFAARELLLLDTRAGVVVDRMTSAVLCRQGGDERSAGGT